MKVYTFKGGASFTEQAVISRFYQKERWKNTFYFIEPPLKEDLYILFSALDKFKHLCDKTINKS